MGIVGSRAYESRVNIALAQLLERIGFRERAERITKEGRADIILLYGGLRIGLEGSYNALDAQRDAERKLEVGLCDLAIALWYDGSLFPQDLSESEIKRRLESSVQRIKIFIPGEDVTCTLLPYIKGIERLPPEPLFSGWLIVDIPRLGVCVRQAVQYVISEEKVRIAEEKITKLIDEFVLSLESLDKGLTVCNSLYETFYRLYGLSVGDSSTIRDLIYRKTALAILLSAVFYEGVRTRHGLSSLRDLSRAKNSFLALEEAFNRILEINYQPVFSVASEAVSKLPFEIEPRLRELISLAHEIASDRVLLRRDFAGKVYHTIVGDWAVRKGFATYFTSIPAAYLLAHLALTTPNEAWGSFGSLEKIGSFRVCDFACGSGTLLSAPYHALQYLYTRDSLRENIDANLDEFHRVALEKVFWGFDALRFATHIAATSLALHNPDIALENMNLYTVPLGVNSQGRICLGSLDLVATSAPRTLMDYYGRGGALKVMPSKEEEVSITVPESFDAIEMNPPFTRATGRGGRAGGGLFGFVTEEEVRRNLVESFDHVRNKIRDEMLKVASQEDFLKNLSAILGEDGLKPFLNVGQAGEGLLFLYLAYKYVKEGGRIAFVLPRSLLSGIGWFLARSLLASKFHVEYIVVSYDSEGGYNFSESTALSESLVVARRLEKHGEGERTCIVNLLRKPGMALEGVQFAHEVMKRFLAAEEIDALEHGYHAGNYLMTGSVEGIVYTVPRRLFLENIDNWGKLLAFTNPELSIYALDLLEGEIKKGSEFEIRIPMKRLGEMAIVGIDRHQFHDSFMKVGREAPGSYPCVYGGEEEVRERMAVRPNAYILPRKDDDKRRKKDGKRLFEEFSSPLLVPDRIWINTAHVISIYADRPVLSNIFYAVRLRGDSNQDPRRLKALCAWLNTTWGLLTVLASRQETRGAWISLKMSHWRLLPVLDVTPLSDERLEEFSRLFEEHKESKLMRLQEQFAHRQEERLNFDLDFLKILNPSVDLDEAKNFLIGIYGKMDEALRKWIG